MPQENQVLQCFSCKTFQVHIVKKAKKWECKICGEKQSFKRHYGKGTGKDCRNHVMKLNELRYMKSFSSNPPSDEVPEESPPNLEAEPIKKKSASKWAQYLDEDVINENENVFKPQKKRKITEAHDETECFLKASHTDSDKVTDQLNIKYTKSLEVEVATEKRKSKLIFDSDLDNANDFLNFI